MQARKDGQITDKEMQEKLRELEINLWIEQKDKGKARNKDAKEKDKLFATSGESKGDPREKKFHAATRKVEKKLKGGEITRDEAFRMLGELRERLWGGTDDATTLARQRRRHGEAD